MMKVCLHKITCNEGVWGCIWGRRAISPSGRTGSRKPSVSGSRDSGTDTGVSLIIITGGPPTDIVIIY